MWGRFLFVISITRVSCGICPQEKKKKKCSEKGKYVNSSKGLFHRIWLKSFSS